MPVGNPRQKGLLGYLLGARTKVVEEISLERAVLWLPLEIERRQLNDS